jgi:NAD(P)-dependent dehydrogenase (short-subunit alcohol dehydrogenase family)
MRFAERSVIVTGAGSGIGQVTASRFAAEGASVLVADRIAARAEAVAAEIQDAGGFARACVVDVSQSGEVEAMMELALEVFGRLDVLVNNAAICEADGLIDIDEGAWDAEMTVDLRAVYLCARAALRRMVPRRSGSIVNVASVNGLAMFGNEAYSAAKAGVISLTNSIAVRYGRHGVRCNAVAPGTIRTPIWEERISRDPAIFERLSRWYPLGRVGEPEDVAAAVLFLASDEASWITGSLLRVDGGLLSGNPRMLGDVLAEPL